MLQNLNLPEFSFNIKENEKQVQIFDDFRKKFVALTPEEWVRQNFLQYLIQALKYPSGLISVEHSIKINHLARRCDIVVFNKIGNPLLIVECKAPEVMLNNQVFRQIVQYNYKLRVPYLIVTNGMQHFALKLNDLDDIEFLKEIPDYLAINKLV